MLMSTSFNIMNLFSGSDKMEDFSMRSITVCQKRTPSMKRADDEVNNNLA